MEVEEHLGERDVVDDDVAVGARTGHVELRAAPVLAERDDRADVLVRHVDRELHERLLDALDVLTIGGSFAGLSTMTISPPSPGLVDVVDDARRGRDEVEVELALEALLDDLHVEQPEEAAAKAEAERLGRVGLEVERRVVHLQLLERVAQVAVVRGVRREDAREDHRLHFLEAGEGLGGRLRGLRERRA